VVVDEGDGGGIATFVLLMTPKLSVFTDYI
jgi:hypothetical protein